MNGDFDAGEGEFIANPFPFYWKELMTRIADVINPKLFYALYDRSGKLVYVGKQQRNIGLLGDITRVERVSARKAKKLESQLA